MTILVFKIAVLLAAVATVMCIYIAIAGFVAAVECERRNKKWGLNSKPKASAISALWPITVPYIGLMFLVMGLWKIILYIFSNPFNKGVRFFYWSFVDAPDEKKEAREELPKARVVNE
jgi:hypothetical protein